MAAMKNPRRESAGAERGEVCQSPGVALIFAGILQSDSTEAGAKNELDNYSRNVLNISYA